MKPFQVVVSTPEGDVFNGEALFLSVCGEEGSLAVMADHAPFVTPVKAGGFKLVTSNSTLNFSSSEGLLIVSGAAATLLVSYATRTPD